ncbi:UPF0755 protein [Clostridiales Family XIII bacterium PM5-7]
MKKIIIAIVAIVVLAIGAGFFYLNSLDKAFDPNQKDTKIITVESGSTTGDIGTLLETEELIDSASSFKLFSKFKGYDGKYQAGTYSISPSMKLSEIAEIMITGKTQSMTFTIPEGYTLFQIANKLSEEGIVNKEKFMDLVENGEFDYDFLKEAQTGENHLEGYLYPETYTVELNASEEDIINTMLSQFESVYTDEFSARAKELGYSQNQIMVIASIIERECVIDDERSTVASVIYNRLDVDMPLQMDSTVQYVLGQQKENLTYKDTEIDSPYNTYVTAGLPPGPIGAPGIASIKAALYPEKTEFIYFVVDKKLDGSHVFSKDYLKFLKDKNEYYQALENQD